MATTDKHPPALPRKYKPAAPIHTARTDPYFGTVIRKAEGAKTVKPGDGQKAAGSKTVPFYETITMAAKRERMEEDAAVANIKRGSAYTQQDLKRLQTHYRKRMQETTY